MNPVLLLAVAMAGASFGLLVLGGRLERVPGLCGRLPVGLRDINNRLFGVRYQKRLEQKLLKAGEPRRLTVNRLLVLQEAGCLVGLGAGWLFSQALSFDGRHAWWVALIGAWLPYNWLNDQVKKRQLRITRELPYQMDLLTLSVEAGLDFTGALAKVVEKGRRGPLNEELGIVLKELKVGKSREDALKSLIRRVDLPALTTFITAVVLADKMGTSLGKVLRIQSAQLRMDRTQRAEKLANQAPVKMLVPLISCIFPNVFLVLFGPIVFALIFGDGGG
jgi:tight adherence protein C